MHKEFSNPENKWKVKGCEIEFKALLLCYNEEGACHIGTENSVELYFDGKIDRLDYYVDEKDVYHYRIVDYKSGNAKNQREKIADAKKVQHVVYAKAIRDMAKKEGIQAKIDCVQFHHIFDKEEPILNYEGEDIDEFPDVVREVLLEVLLKGHYRRLEKCDCNKGIKGKKLLKSSDCTYCSYKDICKDDMGDEL